MIFKLLYRYQRHIVVHFDVTNVLFWMLNWGSRL